MFSEAAIQTCLTLKVLFGLPLRQTTGLVASLIKVAGLDWPTPDFSTLCRRQKGLGAAIGYRPAKGALHLLVDSTGIKVEGDGEWSARKHGPSKPRQWRKVHLGVDAETLEIRAVEVTGSRVGDAPMLPALLDQIPEDQAIDTVTADGAFDTRGCHAAIAGRGAQAVIPPRKNGKPWKGEYARRPCPKRSAARQPPLRSRHLATMERLPPPKPRRDEDELLQSARGEDRLARFRAPGRRASHPRRGAQPLHRPRHARNATRGMNLSGERGNSSVRRVVQQSRCRKELRLRGSRAWREGFRPWLGRRPADRLKQEGRSAGARASLVFAEHLILGEDERGPTPMRGV